MNRELLSETGRLGVLPAQGCRGALPGRPLPKLVEDHATGADMCMSNLLGVADFGETARRTESFKTVNWISDFWGLSEGL